MDNVSLKALITLTEIIWMLLKNITAVTQRGMNTH